MAFLKNKAFLMAVRTGMALTAMLFFTACGKEQDNNTVFYIDDNPVSREEYEMLAQENCNQIYMKYSTEEVNSKDFWTTEKDGETPAKQLEEKILEQLKENYTVKEAAKDNRRLYLSGTDGTERGKKQFRLRAEGIQRRRIL